MRGKQKLRRDWSWAIPVAFALISVNWLAPQFFSLAVVYLHPLIALVVFGSASASHASGVVAFLSSLLVFAADIACRNDLAIVTKNCAAGRQRSVLENHATRGSRVTARSFAAYAGLSASVSRDTSLRSLAVGVAINRCQASATKQQTEPIYLGRQVGSPRPSSSRLS